MGISGRDDSDPWRRGHGDSSPRGRGQGARGPDGRIPAERAPRGNDRDPRRGGVPGAGFGQADRPHGRQGFGRADDFGGQARGPASQGEAPGGFRAGPALRWMGSFSTRITVSILLAATLLGVIGTAVTGSEPGALLGFLVLVGSVIATLGIRRNALYLIFPLPALAYFIGAVVTGGIHDRGIDTSKQELAASFLQWIASVFFWMCATTILVLVLAAARWLLSRQFVSGQFQMSAARRGGRGPRATPAPARRMDRGQRPGSEAGPRDAADPWGDRAGPGAPADRWANRDQRDSRDIWGGRRPSGPRPPGSGPQPGGSVPPGGRNQPGSTGQPGNQPGRGSRGLPPNRPSRDQPDPRGGQNPRGTGGQRPNRDRRDPRDPRDPWEG